jgi:DNA polymerase elongation subunit (family B)
MISVRYPNGDTEVLEAADDSDAAEAALIRELMARVHAADPDVLENHNLHGFDLPFLDRRARTLRVPLSLGRVSGAGMRQRGARRGMSVGDPADGRRVRFVAPGRELIDTRDAGSRIHPR